VARPRSGPTLTPSFREFMPQWLARQHWYLGVGVPVLRPVGAFRLEDPDGEVGIETQLSIRCRT
jgi:Maltokinase N-terminal cap domain